MHKRYYTSILFQLNEKITLQIVFLKYLLEYVLFLKNPAFFTLGILLNIT